MMYPEWKHNENDLESDYYELDDDHESSHSSSYTSSDDEIYEDRNENLQSERFQICTNIHNFSENTKKLYSGEDCEEITCHCSTTCSQGATFCPVKHEISPQQAKQALTQDLDHTLTNECIICQSLLRSDLYS